MTTPPMESSEAPAPPYKYTPLNPDTNEIRIVDILPGQTLDRVHLQIRHVPLVGTTTSMAMRGIQSGEKLRDSLPAEWSVFETIEGRHIFERKQDADAPHLSQATWQHPLTGEEPLLSFIPEIETREAECVYEALSYCWGSEDDQGRAFVCSPDQSDRKQMSSIWIRQNLANAIIHLRLKDSIRTLWIDALCINQEDLVERAYQVRRMREIYSLARRTICWLGSGDIVSETAINTLRWIGAQIEVINNGSGYVVAPECEDRDERNILRPLPLDIGTWQSIALTIRRPWFTRLWVVQEAKLAKAESILQAGYKTVSMSLFRKAMARLIFDRRQIPNVVFEGFDMWSAIRFALETVSVPGRESFFYDLFNVSIKQSSDPRDAIYGSLGLAPAAIVEKIDIDYTVPPREVYRRFCLAYLNAARRLDFLTRCNLALEDVSHPSWVPDWTGKVGPAVLDDLPAAHASGNSCDATTFYNRALHAKEVKCGSIEFASGPVPDNSREVSQMLADLWLKIASHATCSDQASSFGAYVQFLFRGRLRERYPQTEPFPTFLAARKIVEDFLDSSPSGVAAARDSHTASEPVFLNAIFGSFMNWRLFMTCGSAIGMAPADVLVGDVVCVLLGCVMPVVLRSIENGGYKVVCPCYIQGLMDGEALLGPIKKPWQINIYTASSSLFDQRRYLNTETGEYRDDDPRLGDVPSEWELMEVERTASDPIHFKKFRHKTTGEIINGDPRLFAEALRECGVNLLTFILD